MLPRALRRRGAKSPGQRVRNFGKRRGTGRRATSGWPRPGACADLATICLNTITPADPALPGFRLVTTPTAYQREAFGLLSISHRLGVA